MAVWAVSLLTMKLIPHSLTPMITHSVFASLTFVGTPVRARENQCSTPECYYMRLALKLFRREPAITEFDWTFTPTHRSSKQFSACPGSVLHLMLLKFQPAHG